MTSVSKKLLVVLAHPDDETVMAGTIARYSSEGMRITLICTTNGGGGTAPEGVSHEDLCQTRKRELRAACEVLGVSRLELFEDRHAFPYHLVIFRTGLRHFPKNRHIQISGHQASGNTLSRDARRWGRYSRCLRRYR